MEESEKIQSPQDFSDAGKRVIRLLGLLIAVLVVIFLYLYLDKVEYEQSNQVRTPEVLLDQ